jgi:hypothetical protein
MGQRLADRSGCGVVAWTYDHCRTALRAKSTRLALDLSVNVEQIELENDERFTVAGIARILDQTERCDAVGATWSMARMRSICCC